MLKDFRGFTPLHPKISSREIRNGWRAQIKLLVKKSFSFRKDVTGFTLVEMLVVIAIIGILSATVLTALGPARNKAKDARIISNLNQIRAIAETLYDGDYDVLDPSQPEIAKAAADISKNQGELRFSKPSPPALNFAAYSKLASNSNVFYCVDSLGTAKEINTPPPSEAGICPE